MLFDEELNSLHMFEEARAQRNNGAREATIKQKF
jgi:hypothetical protein